MLNGVRLTGDIAESVRLMILVRMMYLFASLARPIELDPRGKVQVANIRVRSMTKGKAPKSLRVASFSREAGEASFSELFGVIEQSFLEFFGALPVIERTLSATQSPTRLRYF